MQYGFGLYPCTLCIYQRIPYGALIVLGLAVYLTRNPSLSKALVLLCMLALLAELGLAGYHVGVEKGVFEGTSSCSPEVGGALSMEALKAMIESAPIASCKDVAGSFMGLSIPAWNALFALSLLLLQLYSVVKHRKTSA